MLEQALRRLLACALFVVAAFAAPAALSAEVAQLKMERSDESVYLSAAVKFELPPVVEDALLKGIPMFFVAEADIYRDRWYWYDKRVTTATRTMRLAFQPLTRRWRLNVLAGAISVTGLRTSLSQNYDSLPEAMASIQRISRWRIADVAEIDADARHTIEFRFRLDLSQLPRPFQIGVAGQRDWTINVQESRQLLAEPIRDSTRDAAPEMAREVAKEALK
ncbi:DUF4390 domain-containing protein [Polaromonas sp.]|uniref:DUF4390 domain-containing protein n=1 Tax=Polaromonas sp. TaxID=1869339 RepID=UPI00356552A8